MIKSIFKVFTNSKTNDWLTPENIRALNACLSSDFAEVREYVRTEMPIILSAIERLDTNLLENFTNQLRAKNPILRINSLDQFLKCLQRFHFECNQTKQNLLKLNLPFIECHINGVKLIGVVDTGAQHSIISKQFVEKCYILHLIDEKFKTKAVGVGEQSIVGIINETSLEISNYKLGITLMVVERFHSNYFLIGQDFLIRHNCVIYCKDRTVFFKDIRLLLKTSYL